MAGGIANAATRSVINGSDFGDNLMAALPDVIGQTIGGMIADGVSGRRSAGAAGNAGGAAEAGAADTGAANQPVAGVEGGGQVGQQQTSEEQDIVVTGTRRRDWTPEQWAAAEAAQQARWATEEGWERTTRDETPQTYARAVVMEAEYLQDVAASPGAINDPENLSNIQQWKEKLLRDEIAAGLIADGVVAQSFADAGKIYWNVGSTMFALPGAIDMGVRTYNGEFSAIDGTSLAIALATRGKGRIARAAENVGGIRTADGVLYNGITGPGPLGSKVASTFRSGSYTEVIASDTTTLYRVYGGKVGEIGPYWTRTEPNGHLQSVIDSALDPAWGNNAGKIVRIDVPSGVKFFEGAAAPQRGLVGGGNQVFVPHIDESWIVR
jgi:hypothetical protein